MCARDDHCTPGGLTCVPCSKLLPQITRITGRIYKVTSRHHEAASNDVLTTSLHSENFHKSHLITEGETEARRGEVPRPRSHIHATSLHEYFPAHASSPLAHFLAPFHIPPGTGGRGRSASPRPEAPHSERRSSAPRVGPEGCSDQSPLSQL